MWLSWVNGDSWVCIWLWSSGCRRWGGEKRGYDTVGEGLRSYPLKTNVERGYLHCVCNIQQHRPDPKKGGTSRKTGGLPLLKRDQGHTLMDNMSVASPQPSDRNTPLSFGLLALAQYTSIIGDNVGGKAEEVGPMSIEAVRRNA